MKVYHGSSVEVATPDLLHSRKQLDFGRGFYLTRMKEQAEFYTNRFTRIGKPGIVSCYSLDERVFCDLKCIHFTSCDRQWLDFILKCRSDRDDTDYDVASGAVANDKVFDTVRLVTMDMISVDEALKRLSFAKPSHQIALRTEAALRYLSFEGSELYESKSDFAAD